jgi:AraC family transcriptional activator FtrA
MHRVAILAHDKQAIFELACAIEIFSLSRPEYDNWYHSDVVTFDNESLEATGNILLNVKQIKDLADYQTLVIPSWSTTNNHVRLEMAEQIVQFSQQGKRVISFCSGAFLLAQLGLLDDKQATTHWRYAELFVQRFPQVKFVNDVLYTHDGNTHCSAGSAAALDLGLEIVRQDHGHVIANQVARRLVVSPHRSGGQAQYVETPMKKGEGAFSQTLDWAISNIDKILKVEDMATQANMSRRSFDRHFRHALGTSPKSWLNEQRIELAKQILESERISIEQLATRVGFDNSITLRFNFNKHVGIAPSQYQSQFADSNS